MVRIGIFYGVWTVGDWTSVPSIQSTIYDEFYAHRIKAPVGLVKLCGSFQFSGYMSSSNDKNMVQEKSGLTLDIFNYFLSVTHYATHLRYCYKFIINPAHGYQ